MQRKKPTTKKPSISPLLSQNNNKNARNSVKKKEIVSIPFSITLIFYYILLHYLQ